VTNQLIALLVQSKAHRTVLALGNPSAFVALHKGRISPSILKKNYLLTLAKGFGNGIDKLWGKHRLHLLSLASHKRINHNRFG
jgi:hypothetical protein